MRATREQHRCPRRSGQRSAEVAIGGLLLALAACGGPHPSDKLVAGGRGGLATDGAERRAGFPLAHSFVSAHARGAYRRTTPRLPGESASVVRAVAAAAGCVPPARRRLRPRLLALRLRLLGAAAMRASARIGDRRDPPFSIAFTINRRGGRWLVTTISLPG